MKRLIIALISAVILCSCGGTGSYSVSSGKSDEGMLSFVSAEATSITVTIDYASSYNMSTVRHKAWRKDRQIRETAQNTLYLDPGQHTVVVVMDGKEVWHKNVFISAQEHKIIEL